MDITRSMKIKKLIAAAVIVVVLAAGVLIGNWLSLRKEPYHIRLHEINSTAISEIGYNRREEILIIRFRNSGDRYAYFHVPEYVYYELEAQDSIGNYFNYKIKGNYDYEKID